MKYYIVFSNTDTRPFNRLRKGFQHVMLLQDDAARLTAFDHSLANTKIGYVYSLDKHAVLSRMVEEGCTVVECLGLLTEFKTPLIVPTCVNMIKRILGISSLATLTPYQLFNYLLKRGGTVYRPELNMKNGDYYETHSISSINACTATITSLGKVE